MTSSIVVDPKVANGEPIFGGTTITVAEILEQLACGMDIADIARTRGGKISPLDVAEAVRLASRALTENAARYVGAATPAPQPAQPQPAQPQPAAQGVMGQLTLAQPGKLTYGVNERIPFHMVVTNLTAMPMKYSYLGVKVANLDTGADEFHTSWSGDDKSIPANGVGPIPGGWDDGIQCGALGHYRLTLSICLASMDEGRNGKGWQTLTPGLDVTIGEVGAGKADFVMSGGTKVYASCGVVGNAFSVEKTTVEVDENVWFNFKVTNTTENAIDYGILSARTEEGQAGKSWTNSKLNPQQVLTWRDHINFKQPGVYHLYLGIGYDDKDECIAMRAPWDRLSDSITVEVRP